MGDVLGNPVVASAPLNRLPHHAIVVHIEGVMGRECRGRRRFKSGGKISQSIPDAHKAKIALGDSKFEQLMGKKKLNCNLRT
jgi:hypothetical protein